MLPYLLGLTRRRSSLTPTRSRTPTNVEDIIYTPPHPVQSTSVCSNVLATMEDNRAQARGHEVPLHGGALQDFERYVKPDACFQAIADGRVVLLSLNWIVDYAVVGKPLPRRQDLPPEAIIDCEALTEIHARADPEVRESVLPIVAVSYCWHTPEHPDPNGEQLRHIAAVLKREFHHQYKDRFDDMGIFMDWVSLYQSKGGPPRTVEQEDVFRKALQSMDLWYAHQGIVTLLVTTPPLTMSLERSYSERGWTSFERCCAELCKPQVPFVLPPDTTWECDGEDLWNLIIDSSHSAEDVARGRQLPRTPQMFRELLQAKHFTNGADREQVILLYERMASVMLSGVRTLSFNHIPWRALDDAQQVASVLGLSPRLTRLELDCAHRSAAMLERVLGSTQLSSLATLSLEECHLDSAAAAAIAASIRTPGLPSLAHLHLAANSIEKAGPLFEALGAGATPLLETLNLSENYLVESDGYALAAAISAGALPALGMLDLSDNPLEKHAAVALFTVLAHGRSPLLNRLLMSNVGAEAVGAVALAALLRAGVLVGLQCLCLANNDISERGMASLASAISEEPLVNLQELDLSQNAVGDPGLVALANCLRKGALPALEILDLADNDISDKGMQGLAAALRACGRAHGRTRPTMIEELRVSKNEGIGAAAITAIGKTMASGALPKLRVLETGDERSARSARARYARRDTAASSRNSVSGKSLSFGRTRRKRSASSA